MVLLEKATTSKFGFVILLEKKELQDYYIDTRMIMGILGNNLVKYRTAVRYNRQNQEGRFYCSPVRIIDTQIWTREEGS